MLGNSFPYFVLLSLASCSGDEPLNREAELAVQEYDKVERVGIIPCDIPACSTMGDVLGELRVCPEEQALFAAIRKNDLKTVQEALRDGADPNAVNCQGIPPLAVSLIYDPKITGALIDAGAQLDTAWGEGPVWEGERMPLMLAIDVGTGTGRWDRLDLLLEAGADVNKETPRGETPATYAMTYGRPSVVLKMLDYELENKLERIAYTAAGRRVGSDYEKNAQKKLVKILGDRLGIDNLPTPE